MSNLGGYQDAVRLIKALGGPKRAAVVGLAVVGTTGYGVLRMAEAGGKRGIGALKSAIKKRNAPCELEDRVFTVRTDGTDDQGLEFKLGAEYKVLECIDDAVLIELVGDDDNPHIVSVAFLTTISDFPSASTENH
ncbi:hypothetical protein [Brachybacterium massiliense]|uniref:hypothetical protein n=1 Tax=Brachybacterium massiliense TaxID=1755098 RepID=UPI00111CF173|nr:hypothetical protein [Brachybacterium massiliense]